MKTKQCHPALFAVGGRLMEFQKRGTFLEALLRANMDGKTIAPKGFYNRILSISRVNARREDEELNKRELYCGTLGIVGARGQRLNNHLEIPAMYNEQKKRLIIETRGASADVMLCCNQGFSPEGIPHLQLFNAAGGETIDSHDKMVEAYKVILRLRGDVYALPITDRNGGILEDLGGAVRTFSWISDKATGGFLRMGGYIERRCISRDVFLLEEPYGRFDVAADVGPGEDGSVLEACWASA